MAKNDGYRRYIEAASVLGQITRARAEEIVKDLMTGGDVQREHAQQWVDELVERSRKATEDLFDVVRAEVANQMTALGLDPDDLARQAADILRRSAKAGRRVVRDMTPGSGTAKKVRGKKAAKKATAKKTAAKKTAAPKKMAAKKTAAPKKAAKKVAAPKKAR